MTEKKFTLKAYILRNWRQYLLLAILLAVWQVAQVAGSVYSGNAITALTKFHLPDFVTNELLSIGSYICYAALVYVVQKYEAVVQKTVDNLIRGDISTEISQQEFENFNAHTEADYVSWFTNDINQINDNGLTSICSLFQDGILSLYSAILLFSYNPFLLVTTIIFAIIMVLFPRIFRKKLADLSTKMSKQNQVLTARLTDILEGFTNLLMLGQRKLIVQKTLAASEDSGQATVDYMAVNGVSSALVNIISLLAQASLTIQAGILAYQHQLPIGAILIVGSMAGNIFGSLTMVSYCLTWIRSVQAVFEKYHIAKKKLTKQVKVSPLSTSIDFENLSFSYDEKSKPIFTNFSGTIKRGERVAIVGPSGCGKSTFVKLLAGLLTGYHGKLAWDGIDYATIDKNSLRQQLAYVDQTAYIFDGSLRFNITLGRSVTDQALQTAINQAGLEDFIAASPQGLDTMLKHAGNNISGGQKQRIALARNLLTEPAVILADEITSAIDEKDGQKIEQGLLDLQGVTLVYISHHLRPEIERQFDRIIRL
ncbi:ABC transporter ATP-binding protein [Lactobacillus sp. ESL0791]|uniref:ABC transporter ATP-binding protein n=1 Tax=Lactobacillus sp. ESL0791 TaxID=2983234 RepID=UPI0023F9CA86|nr:ABC transporter ATP-binding protein [Lactobacillus sp. ESL0791]MDF7639632.1 ABC transporter ATP-binding protein [Lactobacillus sp. ESL0791]